mmetsp:Transcript_36232/g.80627  ORF Transcript_36232/g.80627 Transcript_36232/m.80627 type:complete len:264 (-) Transcript_36232:273-1064(-)
MSNMRSASSSTMKETRPRLVLPCCKWSMKRPGVATTISTPERRSCRCSLICTPPTTIAVRTPRLLRLKARTSRSICCASSRVGASTKPMGPSPGLRVGWCRQCCTMGMEKEAVLPEPVSAQPRMSWPHKAIGMPCAWMGVGVSYLWWRMSAMMLSCKFISVKDSIGDGFSWPGGVCTVTFRRCLISCFCSSVSAKTRSEGFHGAKTASTGALSISASLADDPVLDILPPPSPARRLEDSVRCIGPARDACDPERDIPEPPLGP